MSELETGWVVCKVEDFVDKCGWEHKTHSSYLENVTDQDAQIFYLSLGWTISYGCFDGNPEQQKKAVELWNELNQIFGKE